MDLRDSVLTSSDRAATQGQEHTVNSGLWKQYIKDVLQKICASSEPLCLCSTHQKHFFFSLLVLCMSAAEVCIFCPIWPNQMELLRWTFGKTQQWCHFIWLELLLAGGQEPCCRCVCVCVCHRAGLTPGQPRTAAAVGSSLVKLLASTQRHNSF